MLLQEGERIAENPPRPPEVLVENLKSVQLRYRGIDAGTGQMSDWMPRWDDTRRLPMLVEIRIVPPGRALAIAGGGTARRWQWRCAMNRQHGAALVLGLWLIALMTALVGAFALSARVEHLQLLDDDARGQERARAGLSTRCCACPLIRCGRPGVPMAAPTAGSSMTPASRSRCWTRMARSTSTWPT